MPPPPPSSSRPVPEGSTSRPTVELVADFRRLLQSGSRPEIALLVQGVAEAQRDALLMELILAEAEFKCETGEPISVADYVTRYPQIGPDVSCKIALLEQRRSAQFDATLVQQLQAIARLEPSSATGDSRSQTSLINPLMSLGEFDQWHEIGRGGMGVVNRCRDKKLDRVDRPIAALLTDLKQRGLLEETLVIWGGEFGCTPNTEGKNGRDHNTAAFSTIYTPRFCTSWVSTTSG